eukprot:scaffold1048_cov90-Amphora_coffeaeformis.AAC.36
MTISQLSFVVMVYGATNSTKTKHPWVDGHGQTNATTGPQSLGHDRACVRVNKGAGKKIQAK